MGGWASPRAEGAAQCPWVLSLAQWTGSCARLVIHRISSGHNPSRSWNSCVQPSFVHALRWDTFSIYPFVGATGAGKFPLDSKSLPHAAFTLVGEVPNVGRVLQPPPVHPLGTEPRYSGLHRSFGGLTHGVRAGRGTCRQAFKSLLVSP